MKKIYAGIILLSSIQIQALNLPLIPPTFMEKIKNGAEIILYGAFGGFAGAGVATLPVVIKCTRESVGGCVQFPTVNPDIVVGCGVIGALAGGVFKHRKIKAQKTMLEKIALEQRDQTILLKKQDGKIEELSKNYKQLKESISSLSSMAMYISILNLKMQRQILINTMPKDERREDTQKIIEDCDKALNFFKDLDQDVLEASVKQEIDKFKALKPE